MDRLHELAAKAAAFADLLTPQSCGKQKRFDDRTNFNREFCGATKKPLETPSEFTRAGLYCLLGRITGI